MMTTFQQAPLERDESAPPAGRHRLAYDDQARMWDTLAARSTRKYLPRHSIEVLA
jgi:hypothetical protein